MQQALALIAATLATYGVASLVTNYSGPFNAFTSLRKSAKGELKSALECTVCVATWVSVPIALIAGVGFLGWLAAIGAVILLERWI